MTSARDRLGCLASGLGRREDRRPEGRRPRQVRRAVLAGAEVRDEERRVQCRTPERLLDRVPARGHAVEGRDHAPDRGGSRLLGPLDAEHGTWPVPGSSCAKLPMKYDSATSFRPTTALMNAAGSVARLPDGRFPGCGRCGATGQLRHVVANPQAGCGDEEVRGMTRGDIGKHVAVFRKPATRGVVERQQAAVHQGCGRRAQDVGGERLLLRTGLEDGGHPHLGGQRQRQALRRRAWRRLRRPVEMIEDGADDVLTAHASDRHRCLKQSPDDVDEELPRVGMSLVVRDLANGGEAAGQRHRRDGRLAGAVLRSRRAGRHDDADEHGEESASANGLTHEQPRGSELIYTGWRTCAGWGQPRGRYSAPGDRNYKAKQEIREAQAEGIWRQFPAPSSRSKALPTPRLQWHCAIGIWALGVRRASSFGI